MTTSKRPACLMKQFNLSEIVSTCSAAASYGCRSSGVFYAVDSATLQPVHRCTPAPYGTLAVQAALPTPTLWPPLMLSCTSIQLGKQMSHICSPSFCMLWRTVSTGTAPVPFMTTRLRVDIVQEAKLAFVPSKYNGTINLFPRESTEKLVTPRSKSEWHE